MEDNSNRQIKSGREYDRFFPKPKGEVIIIKRFAKLEDTIRFLPEAIKKTLYQTKLIANELAGGSDYEVAKRVWQFAFDHIAYRKDEPGKEQIQSPQVTWALRAGDCDDFSVFIFSIIHNLKIKSFLRIAMYTTEGGYQHIYPVSLLIGDKELPLDCVARRFNYEVPYIKKIDKNMELQFLNGIPEDRSVNKSQSIDADDLLEGYEGDDIGELGKGKLKAKVQAAVKKVQATKVAAKVQNAVKKVQTAKITQKVQNVVKKVANSKVVQAVKKGVHAVNRVNPAAALLRVGVLTALKTNLLKVAENLRFSYLSPAQVQAQNFDPAKISRLTAIRERLEKIFFGAGGKIENFKASILTGKGNRDKQVAGLGAIDYNDYTQQNHVRQILGIETYNSEIGQVEGLEGLGVVTSAAVAAATSAMSAIAALIKSIGNLRKEKAAKKNAESDTSTSNEGGGNETEANSDSSSNATANETSSGEEPSTPIDEESNQQPQDDASLESDSKSNSGGVVNKSSNADTPASTNKAEGSTNKGTSSEEQSESTGDSADTSNTGGEENSNVSSRDIAISTASAKKSPSVISKIIAWVKANPLPATGIAVVVVGGITYGLVKIFSKDDDKKKSKANHSVAGLPHKKKKNKQFHSHKIKIHKLR